MITSNIFSQRLKELRLKKGLTQTELGEKVGVKQNTFTNWENGKREPNFETLLKLASILNTTTSYLLGESDIYYGYGSKEFKVKIFGTRLREVRKSKKLTQVELANMLNISQKSYSHWETQKTEPTLENVVKLADLFDVSLDWLFGRE